VSPARLKELHRRGTGQVFLCLSDHRCDELGLEPIASNDEVPFRSALTASITHRDADTSFAARARTIRMAIDPGTDPSDIIRPGWVLPARARPGGVLQRAEFAEAAVDLAEAAGQLPAAVIAVVTTDDGSILRGDAVRRYARRLRLPVITIDELIAHRRRTTRLVNRVVSTRLPTEFGDFNAVAFVETLRKAHHLALVKGDVADAPDVLVRVHRDCRFGDIFGSRLCDCGTKLQAALASIEAEGRGVIVYLVGAPGTLAKCTNDSSAIAYREGHEFGVGAQILADLGLSTIRVLTNSDEPIDGIAGFGLQVTSRLRLPE
jgi:3,4-dihydroxy 2-butanone 4-phosphate synthase/GTP cyclohydrolase II